MCEVLVMSKIYIWACHFVVRVMYNIHKGVERLLRHAHIFPSLLSMNDFNPERHASRQVSGHLFRRWLIGHYHCETNQEAHLPQKAIGKLHYPKADRASTAWKIPRGGGGGGGGSRQSFQLINVARFCNNYNTADWMHMVCLTKDPHDWIILSLVSTIYMGINYVHKTKIILTLIVHTAKLNMNVAFRRIII